jgi:hypothetical protein
MSLGLGIVLPPAPSETTYDWVIVKITKDEA